MDNTKRKQKEFERAIPEIEKILGYTFRDPALLRQAFTRTSFCNEANREGYCSNEVLEFFGDSVLSAAIVTVLIRDFTERNAYGMKARFSEGEFSNIKSKLSDKTNLSASMRELGLSRFLLLGEGDEKLGIQNEPSVMEDLYESLLGAIYIDSDRDLATVLRVVEETLDISAFLSSAPPIQSYKNALQEYCAEPSHRLPSPTYHTLSESGPEHEKIYTRGCKIGGELIGIGKGKNLKLADNAAAKETLGILKQSRKEHTPAVGDTANPADTYASRLYEYAAKHGLKPPVFLDLGKSERASEVEPLFDAECRFTNRVTRATSHSKKTAKQLAAERMLILISSK